jgi:hypothetical protein
VPRTVSGDEDGWTGVAVGLGDAGGAVTAPDRAGEGDDAADGDAVCAAVGDALCAAVGDNATDVADPLGLACPVTGLSASDPVDDAA